MRILGLDIGEKYIGVALSDPEGILGIPLTVISRAGMKRDWEALHKLVRQYEAERIVIGLPYSLDGTLGQQAERIQDFVAHLSQSIEIPIETWDERLSTVAAKKMRIDTRAKRARRRERVDAAAAAIILQGYLDRMHVKSKNVKTAEGIEKGSRHRDFA